MVDVPMSGTARRKEKRKDKIRISNSWFKKWRKKRSKRKRFGHRKRQ